MEGNMKKRSIISIRPVLAFLLFTLAGGVFAQASFVEVYGTVEVKPAGVTAWKAAAVGMAVAPDTAISTSFRSTAILQVGSSRILLRPLTRLTLKEIAAKQGTETEDIQFYLQSGRIRGEVSPPRGGKTEFTVRSPSAVASARGTSFEFDTINLSVDNGLVLYSYVNGLSVYVAGQEASYVEDQSRRVVPPQELARESRIPQIPQYHTGVEETPDAPRYSPGTGLTLIPSWTP
jgi:hypothetical protein